MSIRVLSRNYKPTYVAGTRYDPKWSNIRQHCVGLWPFWERGSGTIQNWARRGAHGTLTKGTASEWRDMQNGPGIHFDGTGIVDSKTTRLGPVGLFAAATERWTAVHRIRTTATVGNGFCRSGAGATGTRQFVVYWATGSEIPGILLRGNITGTSWGLADGSWHTIWVTWDGTTGIGYYDDARGSTTLSVGTAAEETSENITLGARTAGTPGGFLVADIDFAAILDIPLDPGTIARWNTDLMAPWRPARRYWKSTGPTATLSGTATSGMTESDVVAGGKVLTITLANATWIP